MPRYVAADGETFVGAAREVNLLISVMGHRTRPPSGESMRAYAVAALLLTVDGSMPCAGGSSDAVESAQ